MAREAKDRSSEWLIEHHADSLLLVAGVTGFTSCKAVNPVMVHPKRIPDGLLEVTFPEHPTPSIFLVEVTTYPDKEERDQVMEDVALVLLERRVVPEVISIVLSTRGNQTLKGEHQRTSRHGRTSLLCKWEVVRLWELRAATPRPGSARRLAPGPADPVRRGAGGDAGEVPRAHRPAGTAGPARQPAGDRGDDDGVSV